MHRKFSILFSHHERKFRSVISSCIEPGLPIAGIIRVRKSRNAPAHFDYHFVYETQSVFSYTEQPIPEYQQELFNYIEKRLIVSQLNYHEVCKDDLRLSSPVDFAEHPRSCVLIGSYRKHFADMQNVLVQFEQSGITVLSPQKGTVVNPSCEFILLDYDPEILTEGEIQAIVLKKMDKASFTYLVNPTGTVGISASFEMGYGLANNLTMFSMEPIQEIHQHFMPRPCSPKDIVDNWSNYIQASQPKYSFWSSRVRSRLKTRGISA